MKLKHKSRVSSNDVRKRTSKKLNPFEVHINRSKHQVLGRQLKSDRGLPGVSKTKALMKRKTTLLQEYKIRGKSNQFIDQRIGERNKNMTEDDRIMARFAAERMRLFNKKSMFNLSESEVLTHKGQTLSEIERFEDTRSDDEEDDEGRKNSGALKGRFVGDAHFGGGMLRTSKQDRESLIDQLINESKKRKAERQRNKEETLEATEQLDEEWKSLGVIVTSTKETEEVNNQMKDQYDIVMRQLKFEPHGQPSQRLKTEEEIAKEDREQLEKLEKERLKQLREIELNKYGSHKSADDLDDGFSNIAAEFTENDLAESSNDNESSNEDEEGREHPGDGDEMSESDAIEEDEDEEGDGEKEEDNEPKTKRKYEESIGNVSNELITVENTSKDVEEDEGQFSLEENGESTGEQSDDECAMDDFTDLMPSVKYESATLITGEKNELKSKTSAITEEQEFSKAQDLEELDLPYVFNIPDDYESFRDLLKNRSIKQQSVIFERLLKSNHPTLEPGNKRKMLTLAGYIIELVCNGNITWESLPLLVSQFNLLKEFNKEECLKMMVDSLSTKLENLSRVNVPVQSLYLQSWVKYLTWYIIVFIRPQGMDVLVPISKPALSLVVSLVTRTNHVTLGLLCCYLLLQDAKISSKVYPEAISYLNTSITNISEEGHIEREQDDTKSKNNTNNRDEASEDYKLNLHFENDAKEVKQVQVLHCSVILLTDFVKVYRKYPQSKLMFKPTHDLVCNLKVQSCCNILATEAVGENIQSHLRHPNLLFVPATDAVAVETYPPTLKKEICELQTLLKVLSSAQLSSLAKNTKKPKALRQYEPCICAVTVGRSQRGLPAEVQEEQKLLHKYKHEMKGAMRELRRDRVFLANVKLRDKALSDEQRMKKVKEIFSSGAVQQGELRSLKRKK